MNHQEKRRETIHDVIGQMTDGYLEEAANDSAVFRGETVGARRRKAVLKWAAVAAAALLVVSGMVFAAVVREKAKRPSDTPGTTQDRMEAEAVLQFAPNGDGTCSVIGMSNPSKADYVNVNVPAEYNGEKVVAYVPTNIALPYPEVLSAEAFRVLLNKMANAINADSESRGFRELNWEEYETPELRNRMAEDSGNELWYEFTRFRSFYDAVSLKKLQTEEKNQLLERFPGLADAELYVLPTLTQTNRLCLAGTLMTILPEYSAADKFSDEMSAGLTRGSRVVSTQITEASFPETLLNIGNETCMPMVFTGVSRVRIPRSVHSCTGFAFVGCAGLSAIDWFQPADEWEEGTWKTAYLPEEIRKASPGFDPAGAALVCEVS